MWSWRGIITWKCEGPATTWRDYNVRKREGLSTTWRNYNAELGGGDYNVEMRGPRRDTQGL